MVAPIQRPQSSFRNPPTSDRVTTISQYHLKPYEQIPTFLKANRFIRAGYRVHFSFFMCLYSLLRIHNESGNIYTHLVASSYFLWQAVDVLLSDEALEHTLPLALFCMGCVVCYLASTGFHTFKAH